MKELLQLLKDKNLTISFAESMTGGYLSRSITKYNGASKAFKGAIVAYNKEVKINVLKVDEKIIDEYSIVSKEVAEAMALGLSKVIDSDIYVSITGNAGPTLENNTNKFKCFITLLFKGKLETFELVFKNGSRNKNILTAKNFVKMIVYNTIL